MSSPMRVARSPLTNTIYCGRIKGDQWDGQTTDVTIDALVAVAEHVLSTGLPLVITGNGDPLYEITVRRLEKINDTNV